MAFTKYNYSVKRGGDLDHLPNFFRSKSDILAMEKNIVDLEAANIFFLRRQLVNLIGSKRNHVRKTR